MSSAGIHVLLSFFSSTLNIVYNLMRQYYWSMSHVDILLLLFEKVAFCTYKNFESIWTVLFHLWEPFVKCMIEGFGIYQGKTYQEKVSIRIRKTS